MKPRPDRRDVRISGSGYDPACGWQEPTLAASPAHVVVADEPDTIRLTVWRTTPAGFVRAELTPLAAMSIGIKLIEAAQIHLGRKAAEEDPA